MREMPAPHACNSDSHVKETRRSVLNWKGRVTAIMLQGNKFSPLGTSLHEILISLRGARNSEANIGTQMFTLGPLELPALSGRLAKGEIARLLPT